MPHVDRPPKAGNTRQFQTEVAAGFIDILANEVDGDIDTIYALCNGNLADDNIVANAHIAYSKLALAGSIKGSDIAPGAGINGSALSAGTVPASAIAPNSITDVQLTDGVFVAKPNLAAGVTTQDIQQATNDTVTSFPANNVETIIAETAWTSRTSGATYWMGIGRASGYFTIGGSGQQGTATFRIRYGGGAGVVDGNVGDIATIQAGVFSGGTGFLPINVTLVFWGAFAIGATRLKLTVQVATPATLNAITINNRRIQVWEPT